MAAAGLLPAPSLLHAGGMLRAGGGCHRGGLYAARKGWWFLSGEKGWVFLLISEGAKLCRAEKLKAPKDLVGGNRDGGLHPAQTRFNNTSQPSSASKQSLARRTPALLPLPFLRTKDIFILRATRRNLKVETPSLARGCIKSSDFLCSALISLL